MAANTPAITPHARRLARFVAKGHLVTVHTEDDALTTQAAFAALPEAKRRGTCTVRPLNSRTWLLSASASCEGRGEE